MRLACLHSLSEGSVMHMDCPTRPKQGDNPVHEATRGIVTYATVSLDVPASPTVSVFVVVVPSEVMIVTEVEDDPEEDDDDDPEEDDDDELVEPEDDELVEPEDDDPEEDVLGPKLDPELLGTTGPGPKLLPGIGITGPGPNPPPFGSMGPGPAMGPPPIISIMFSIASPAASAFASWASSAMLIISGVMAPGM